MNYIIYLYVTFWNYSIYLRKRIFSNQTCREGWFCPAFKRYLTWHHYSHFLYYAKQSAMENQMICQNKMIREKDTSLAFSFLFLLIWFFTHYNLLIYLSMLIIVTGMIFPFILRPLSCIWFWLASVLGHVSSTILLTFVWLVLVVPVGLLRRALGKDSLNLKKWHRNTDSVFVKRSHTFTAEDIANPY